MTALALVFGNNWNRLSLKGHWSTKFQLESIFHILLPEEPL